MENVQDGKAVKYCRWCVDETNHDVGIYVKKQAQEFINIAEGRSDVAELSNERYQKVLSLLRVIIHPDLQCPMSEGLEDYAWLLITAVFCTVRKGTNFRYYQTALLEIARKNFKTFNSAIIFIIAMLTEKKFSRFFSVAPDLKLSKELQLAIKKIIKSSPTLADDKIFKNLRSEIRCLLTESEYNPLAYSDDKMDGKLATIFLADESGALDSYPVEAMRSSQITLNEKLGILISTQYPNDNNVMIDEIDISKKVLDGLIDAPYFALLYEPDSEYCIGDDWQTNDTIIKQANPVAIAHSYIFEELKKMRSLAVLYENKRENFLCKHLNIKFKGLGVEGFIDVTKVKECRIEEDLNWWKGRRVYMGLDLSQTEDNTSVAMCTLDGNNIVAKVWGFIPKNGITRKTIKEHVDYQRLINQGVCFACGDDIIDYGFVEQFILDIPKKYGVEIVQLGFDRWNAISTVQKLEGANEPIECVEIKQHSSVLHAPTKLLKERILDKSFKYDDNALLEINFENARCTEDTNLNKYINKKKSNGKVDMVVSIVNALYLLQTNELLDNDVFVGFTI